MKITGYTPMLPLDPNASSLSSTVNEKSNVSSPKQLTLANVETKEGSVFLQALQSEERKTLEQRSAVLIPTDSLETTLSQVKTQTKLEDVYGHCDRITQDASQLAQLRGLAQEENLQTRHLFLGLLASR